MGVGVSFFSFSGPASRTSPKKLRTTGGITTSLHVRFPHQIQNGETLANWRNEMLLVILIILILVFGFGGYRMGPGLGYYGGGGLSLILLIILILLLLRVI